MSEARSVSVDELEQAFEVFSRVSIELDTSYRELESRVDGLTQQLATARTARQNELAEKERLAHRLSSLVAALPGGVLILDSNQVISDVNPEAVQLLDTPLIGEAWHDVLLRVSGSGELQSRELLLISGRRVSVVSRALGKLGEHVVLITDVSEIHELQEQLSRKKRLTALGEMAARLAHQIRTPLSSTVLYLAQLGRPDLPADQRQNICTSVGDRLSQMGKLVDGMLCFVRGEAPAKEIIYLHEVLSDFQLMVLPQFEKNGSIVLVPHVDSSLVIVGNRDELVGALGNLAMNALEAADGPVTVTLWVGALSDNWLQIRIRDDGPGIGDEHLDRVFDPFFTTRAQGTGLGLAVVAMTVNNHGGEISVRNLREGGAEFLIQLPIHQPDESGLSERKHSAIAGGETNG